MLYFCCQIRTNGKLANLVNGDIVAFGSRLQGQFVLDTLFVVDQKIDPGKRRICGLFSSVNGSHPLPINIIYTGMTAATRPPTGSMFSYFPAKVITKPPISPFQRPAISQASRLLSRLINDKLGRNFKATTINNPHAVWADITQLVLRQNLVLGLVAH